MWNPFHKVEEGFEDIMVNVEQELKWTVENQKNIHSETMNNSLQQNSAKEVCSGMRKTAD